MRSRVASLSPRALLALAAAGVLLYAAVVWLLVVSPKRSEASSLAADVAAAEIRLGQARAAANRPRSVGAPVGDVFRLAKAMPASNDQSGLILELSRLAFGSGVKLGTIAPEGPVVGTEGATMIPVEVTLSGTYFEIARFLKRTRRLVTVRSGKVRATGRLFTVQRIDLVESVADGYPKLDGTITLNAYVYDGPIVSAETPNPADESQPTSGTSAAGRVP